MIIRKFLFPIIFLIPTTAIAGNLISSMTWSESGDYKMAREDQVPWIGSTFCSTCVISRTWDTTTIKLFGAKGELITWVTYLIGGSADALNVMVKISSFTGTGLAAGTGFSAVAVSSSNVWDYTQRPYSLYVYRYLKVAGMDNFGAWDPTEYDEQQVPQRWQVPCTLQAAGYCSANGGTNLWSNRQDQYKYYPDIAVPIEEFTPPANSSFTVAASSSQAIGGEVYISTGVIANSTYTATLTVYEGANVSTTIPIALYVYNVTLGGKASLPVIADLGEADLAIRLNGNRTPSSYYVEPYLTAGLRTSSFLHRHKVIAIGDTVPDTTKDYPSPGYSKHIDGSAYKEAYGLAYNTSPGYGIADSFYMIGAYGNWKTANWSTTVTGGVGGYCTNVSSWTSYCTSNNLNCQLYTSNDEASAAVLAGEVNTESTWSSTAPACAFNGSVLPYFQTGVLPTVIANASNVNTVVSTSWLKYSSTTWANDETLYNSSTHSAGGYNTGSPGTDSLFALQEEGLGPREVMWGAYKTNQKYWFLWEINYWQDTNNAGQAQNGWNANSNNDNDTFNLSKTFGYDSFPSTSAVKGHFGFNFANTNGNMLYPGTDTVYTNPSYGFDGVMGSWRLNQLTRGIQDVDIINKAFAISSSITTTIVNQQVQDVMYLRQCFTLADCTYSYGVRPWNENLNSWEKARENLLQIAASAPSQSSTSSAENWQGITNINGTIQIR